MSAVEPTQFSTDQRAITTVSAAAEFHMEWRIRVMDWRRVRSHMEDAKTVHNPVKDSTTWVVAFISLALGFVFGLVPAAAEAHPHGWELAFYSAGIVLFLALALVTHIFGKDRKDVADAISKICEEMDEIEAFYSTRQQEGAGA